MWPFPNLTRLLLKHSLRFLLLAFKAYSDIWLYEWKHLPDRWEKDGRPRGIEFWKFPKPTWKDMFFRPALFRTAAVSPMLWLFVDPEWTEGHEEVLKYFGNLRKNVLWWNIGFLSFCVFIVLTLSL